MTPTAPPALTALDALPAVQRRVLVMRHVRGMAVEEIAAADRVAAEVVARRLAHGELAFAHHLGAPRGPETPGAIAARELAALADLPDLPGAPGSGPVLAPLHAPRSRLTFGWADDTPDEPATVVTPVPVAPEAVTSRYRRTGVAPDADAVTAATRTSRAPGPTTPARGCGGVARSGLAAAASVHPETPPVARDPEAPCERRSRLPLVAGALAAASVAALGAAVATSQMGDPATAGSTAATPPPSGPAPGLAGARPPAAGPGVAGPDGASGDDPVLDLGLRPSSAAGTGPLDPTVPAAPSLLAGVGHVPAAAPGGGTPPVGPPRGPASGSGASPASGGGGSSGSPSASPSPSPSPSAPPTSSPADPDPEPGQPQEQPADPSAGDSGGTGTGTDDPPPRGNASSGGHGGQGGDRDGDGRGGRGGGQGGRHGGGAGR
ncbi:hypothetical protein [Actinomycetospora chlora]|uniref:hypothetical protein n=1 Tax=Actinomycetospora chlora TaxID=663608 RepID=UPI0031EF7EB7